MGSEKRDELAAVARGGLLSLVGAGSSALFGYLLVVIVARGLGAHEAGVFFEAIALFTIVSAITQLGADAGLVRGLPRQLELGRAADVRRSIVVAVVPVLAAGTALGVLMFAFAPEISRLVIHGADDEASVPYLRVLALFLPLSAASRVVLAGARGLGTILPFVVVENLGKSALRPLLALAVVLAGLGSVALALTWALPIAAGFLVAIAWLLVLLARRERGERPRGERTESRQLAREFWAFAAFRGAALTCQVAIAWLDVLLVGALASAAAAGVYAAAGRYIAVGSFALQAVILVIGPQVSVLLARGDTGGAQRMYQTATWWLAAVAFPIYLTLAVFAPFFVGAFGAGFSSGESVLTIVAPAMLVSMAAGPVTVMLLMAGKSSWNLANTAVALSVNVGLNFVLIPRFGIEGAAAAWATSIVLANLLPLVEVRTFLRLQPLGAGLAVVSLASAVCFGVFGALARLALGVSPASFALFAAVGTGVYVVVLWRFRAVLRFAVFRDAVRVRAQRAAVQT